MDEFNRLLGRLRWRLGFERLLQFGVRGAMGSGAALIALSSTVWLTGNHATPVWPAAGPLFAAFVLGISRWPSRRHAAIAADRRLLLQNRLATAVELSEGRQQSRFGALQIQDALGYARAVPVVWLALDSRARNEALLAGGVVVLGLASLLLPGLPSPFALAERNVPADTLTASELGERAIPVDSSDTGAARTQPIQGAQPQTDLASRVQQAQAERSALDNLAHALGSVSAGQQAADAIQQGDFAAARNQLQSLADQADQLSDAAKQQLARALQQASAATAATDRQLADKERQAAQALSRSSYSEQRQALRGLADQVERSGARSMPADQLQRDLGQLQQQGASAGQAAGASDRTPGAAGQGSSSSADQQATTGAGVGSGVDPNVTGDPSRLDTAGQRVQVPTKLNDGPGARPPDGSEDQTGANPSISGGNVSELPRAQQTGQVAPEENLVPGEQRPVIRGYFR